MTDISSPLSTANRPLAGMAWMVVTGLCFVVVIGIVRHLGSNLPAVESAFIRYLVGIVLFLPILLRMWRRPPEKKLIAIFAIRGLVHGIGVTLWFFAMARIPIAEVTAIGYTSPIFITIGAAIFLGERLRARRMVGILVGLVGALIILRPGFAEISIGQLAQLAAAPLFAISYLMTKRLTSYARPDEIVAMLTVFCTLVLLPGAVIDWQTPTLNEVLWLSLTALFASFAHFALTKALEVAPISVTQPISFLQLIWATLLGILLFDEVVDPYVIAGGAIIVAAASYIAHREVQLARKAPRE